MDLDESFKARVYQIVGEIPAGRLMTYGQIAAMCGHPRAARIVGQMAHWGPSDLPWQRVVHKDGLLASGFPGGGCALHKQLLEHEGVDVDAEFRADITNLIWWPNE
jgi:methylated-DNA-protein-cysteine methyltransferase-like protein